MHVNDRYKRNLANVVVPQFWSQPVSHHKGLEVYISEPGLYELIFSSKLPSANDFKRVYHK